MNKCSNGFLKKISNEVGVFYLSAKIPSHQSLNFQVFQFEESFEGQKLTVRIYKTAGRYRPS